jgi:hypothetical protein
MLSMAAPCLHGEVDLIALKTSSVMMNVGYQFTAFAFEVKNVSVNYAFGLS